jgi:molybdenum cofactor cytidylyltransferase
LRPNPRIAGDPGRATELGAAASTPAVAGLVLAAGASRRMGQNKLLLDVGGEPLVRRTVRRALEAGLDPVVVVLGFEADLVRSALADLPCRLVVNANHARGQIESIRTGLLALPPSSPAAVTLLADMPLVTAGMIARLADRFRMDGVPLVVSEYGGVQAPPTLYARPLFAEILTLEEGACARQVARRHRAAAAVLEWPAAALLDLDSPGDYARFQAIADAERPEEEPR